MSWLIIIVVVSFFWIIFYYYRRDKERNINAKELFDSADNYYNDIQRRLQKEIYDTQHDISDSLSRRAKINYYTYREVLALWRKHVVTVISTDELTLDAQITAANSWLEFMIAEKTVQDCIEAGVYQDEAMQSSKNAQDIFFGVMEARGYDLQNEYENAEDKYRKYFSEKPTVQRGRAKKK